MNITDYTELVLHEHRTKTKFMRTLAMAPGMLIEWMTELQAAVESIDIDNAEAPYIDVVGAWIGKLRASLPNQPVDDDLYQLILRAKIIANHWDGSTEQLYSVWDTIFQGSHKLIVQDIGTMRILIALLGEAVGAAYSTMPSPFSFDGRDYVDGVAAIIKDGSTWYQTAVYSGGAPALAVIDGLLPTMTTLSVYLIEGHTAGKYYTVISNASWADIMAHYAFPNNPAAIAPDAYVYDGTDYIFTAPTGWTVCTGFMDPPVITFGADAWSPVTADELAMLIDGHIVPKPSGVEIVEYATLTDEGKIFGVDIENEYFAGIGNIETGAGGGLIAEEDYT